MPKRKRDGGDSLEAEGGEESSKSMRQRRVEHKLDHGYKLLNKAFKTAKGFERQKLGRRRKTACEKGDSKDVERIDGETEAIKVLDFSAAAKNYLHKSLLKFKAVAESPNLPKAVSIPPAPMPNAATANVIARLCNSNPVKEALPSILKDIQQMMGIQVSDDKLKGKKRLRAKDFEEVEKDTERSKKAKQTDQSPAASDHDSDDDREADAAMQRRPHSDNEDDISASDVEDEDDGAGYDSDDFAQFDDRIASSSDEDAGSDNESLQNAKQLRKSARDLSLSPSPEPQRQSKKMEKPTKSAFIPSLTMGGYWSGSDSEPEDDIDVAPRKNRRGQRARQAIAEKKFGQNAKHLQKQAAAGKTDRNQGWDPKRGATDSTGPRQRGPHRPVRSAPRTGGGGDMSKPPPKKHRDDSGPLHPSWEAAKKAKEAKVTATFQGKKVTFD